MRQRKSIRLKCWNYSNDGIYFITICTKDKSHWFGDVENGEMVLNNCGKIAKKCWSEIPNHFKKVELGEFVVMPNHIHGLIEIRRDAQFERTKNVGSSFMMTKNTNGGFRRLQRDTIYRVPTIPNNPMFSDDSISKIVRGFKGRTAFKIHKINADFKWQSRFYDHIIRDETDYETKHYYIVNNPNKWTEDKYNKIW